eukprot:TRINITY_DN82221_c0_g1_i1.p1 TRINITY_DN82221_c0_g1~~TRINITY_DN82221_c0_g1_i1.p1  ORF type:complete len:234 (+),score=67.83 TRINITY_DN82221_c0_g1_i1:68-769(+)
MAEPPKKRYKLSYFDCRGRAELTRLLFAHGGVEYDDDRVKRENFQQMKAAGAFPFGQFPVLSIDGGPSYSQSYAIAKYAAKVVGLMPSDTEQQLACDMVILTTEDVRSKLVPIRYSGKVGDERLALYDNFYQNILPGFLTNFQKLLAGKQYFVGDTLTVADFAIFNMCLYLTFPACEVQAASEEAKKQQLECLDAFPEIKRHKEMMEGLEAVAKWLAARPPQEHDNVLTMAGK